ncbi:MAG: hypothetical protein KKD35_02680 [Elusimicrobia bacterium]|nr:hypothetical protein [Elusimicrobiota bacterium]
MENEIPKSIYNIGKLAYPLAILTGKNYQVKKITKEIVNKNKEAKQIEIPGDFIMTIGKKNVILTKHQNGRREPIIVRPWKKNEPFYKGHWKIIPYVDVESYNWFHVFDNLGEFVSLFKEEKNENGDLVSYHLELG